jgi:hypothetical protein
VKVIELSNKVFLTRHWFKWYFVKRGGQEWEPVGKPKNRKRTKPFSIEKAAASLAQRSGSRPADTILDEAAADREVEKNTPKS